MSNPPHIPAEDISLPRRLDAVFALQPGANAIGFQGVWSSYDSLKRIAERLQTLVSEVRNESGVPIGILLRNRSAHFATALGTLWARHCLVTVNPLLPQDPLAKDILDLRVPILIADIEDWRNAAFASVAREVGSAGIWISTQASGLDIGWVHGMHSVKQRDLRPNAPGVAIEMLSSGTTGAPKRIKLDAASFEHSLWAGSKYEAGNQGGLRLKHAVGIQWMPLVHIGGLFGAMYSIYNGRSFVLLERFDLDAWHGLILEYRPKFVNVPPSALHALLERNFPKEDFASLLALRCGAAPLDQKLAVEFESRYGIPVLEGYGATEFAGGVAGWTIRDHQKYSTTKRASVGRANAGVELRIVDPTVFTPLGTNQPGLLEVRTPQIDRGRTWVRTTDLARVDQDGFLYILGRADNAIIRGGFKVMPGHIEVAIREHPEVSDVCVVGLSHPRLGQVPVAAIERVASSALDGPAIAVFLRTRLKPYEIPVDFRFVSSLPRTPSLKVSQAAVRELFASRTPD
jgi:long-chain acyl-CoA synthetase